jgi:hypothetical protein
MKIRSTASLSAYRDTATEVLNFGNFKSKRDGAGDII